VLSGGGTSRILAIHEEDPSSTSPALTVQNLALRDGRASGTWLEGGGGAIYRRGGTLTVINSRFTDNVGVESGLDIAGGAIYSHATGPTTIVRSVFDGNECSNGGALGSLSNELLVVNSLLLDNVATGSAGVGGAVYVDGITANASFCGTRFANNEAESNGGAMFRVAYTNESVTFDRCTFDGNTVNDGGGGAMYIQDAALTITASTLVRNQATNGGALRGVNVELSVTNSTLHDNTATGLGGGLSLLGTNSGTLTNLTIAGNQALFAAGIAGGSGVTLNNSIIANTAVNGFNPINCNDPLTDGGGNLQFPSMRSGGDSDTTAPCASGITFADPILSPLEDNGGPTETMLPASDSPARGSGSSCPGEDQRGIARAAACTSGAVEY
jgi:hypothetical protein